MQKADVVATIKQVMALPALAGLLTEERVSFPECPFDGVMFYADRPPGRIVDLYFDYSDGPGCGQWMLQGSDLDKNGEIDFVFPVDPSAAEFSIVPVILSYLRPVGSLKEAGPDAYLRRLVGFAEAQRECYHEGFPEEVAWRHARDVVQAVPALLSSLGELYNTFGGLQDSQPGRWPELARASYLLKRFAGGGK